MGPRVGGWWPGWGDMVIALDFLPCTRASTPSQPRARSHPCASTLTPTHTHTHAHWRPRPLGRAPTHTPPCARQRAHSVVTVIVVKQSTGRSGDREKVHVGLTGGTRHLPAQEQA